MIHTGVTSTGCRSSARNNLSFFNSGIKRLNAETQRRKGHREFLIETSFSLRLCASALSCQWLQRRGEVGGVGEILVDTARGRAPFGDGPDDERLAVLHVAGGEHPRHGRHPAAVVPDVAAVGEFHAELLQQAGTL